MRCQPITGDTTSRSKNRHPSCCSSVQDIQHHKLRLRFDAPVDINTADRQRQSHARRFHHQRLDHHNDSNGNQGNEWRVISDVIMRQKSRIHVDNDLRVSQTKTYIKRNNNRSCRLQPVSQQRYSYTTSLTFAHKQGHPAPCRDAFFN